MRATKKGQTRKPNQTGGGLDGFANTLIAQKSGLIAYYDYPISTGSLEGTNNKIRTMQKQAYGFRDVEFFKLKIRPFIWQSTL